MSNLAQVEKFSAMCGASVPDSLKKRFAGSENDADLRNRLAIEFANEQCEALIHAGVEHIHFYTLNRADLTLGICAALQA